MSFDRSRYPDNWPGLRAAVLARAGNRCEQCGAPNERYIVRDRGDPFNFHVPANGMDVEAHQECGDWVVWVVLTIAHKHGTSMMSQNLDDLLSLCQRCHNTYAAPARRGHAAETRRRKQRESGQLVMKDI